MTTDRGMVPVLWKSPWLSFPEGVTTVPVVPVSTGHKKKAQCGQGHWRTVASMVSRTVEELRHTQDPGHGVMTGI